jgi:hypothetical protein
MTELGARTRQMGTFPVNRGNIRPAQNAGPILLAVSQGEYRSSGRSGCARHLFMIPTDAREKNRRPQAALP